MTVVSVIQSGNLILNCGMLIKEIKIWHISRRKITPMGDKKVSNEIYDWKNPSASVILVSLMSLMI